MFSNSFFSGPTNVYELINVTSGINSGMLQPTEEHRHWPLFFCTKDKVPTSQVNPKYCEVWYWKVISAEYLPVTYSELAILHIDLEQNCLASLQKGLFDSHKNKFL